jgi:hypothetical protein
VSGAGTSAPTLAPAVPVAAAGGGYGETVSAASESDAPSMTPSAAKGAIVNLTLVKSTTGADIVTLMDGDTVSLSSIGTTLLSIRADTEDNVASVRFTCDGIVHSEDSPPFVMSGKSDYDVYVAAASLAQSGPKAILVEAFDSSQVLIDVHTISFTMVA